MDTLTAGDHEITRQSRDKNARREPFRIDNVFIVKESKSWSERVPLSRIYTEEK